MEFLYGYEFGCWFLKGPADGVDWGGFYGTSALVTIQKIHKLFIIIKSAFFYKFRNLGQRAITCFCCLV